MNVQNMNFSLTIKFRLTYEPRLDQLEIGEIDPKELLLKTQKCM